MPHPPDIARPVALLLAASCLFSTASASVVPVAVLHWTATGDDGTVGRANRYDIRRSLLPISAANFGLADTVGGAPAPANAGAPQSCTVIVPVAGQTYYFALKAADERNNWSLVSNVASYTVPVLDSSDPELQAREFEPPWPNPARGHAMIRITSPSGDDSEVSIYDAMGRHVRTLWDGRLEPGRHGLEWDLRDERSSLVSPGVYFARVSLGEWARVRRLVVTR